MGKGFAVVANEVQRLAQIASDIAPNFESNVLGRIGLTRAWPILWFTRWRALGSRILRRRSYKLIVRNLFERTADVRWWATDTALWQALNDPSAERRAFAAERLVSSTAFTPSISISS